MTIVLRLVATASASDAGIPLSSLRTWIEYETFPAGRIPRRIVGLMEVVRESGKIWDVMRALVAAQSLGDMREA